jgi:hypothetical protein
MDPNNLTRREVIDSQLTATSVHMIQISVGSKDFPHIQHFYTAKEALEGLFGVFVGNPSMKRTSYDALSNQAVGFFMLEGEDHGGMYRRLKGIATSFRNHGALHIDDNWIKMKYVSSLMPVAPISLKSPDEVTTTIQ